MKPLLFTNHYILPKILILVLSLFLPLLTYANLENNNNVKYLFVKSVPKVKIEVTTNKNNSPSYKIVIKNIDPQVAYFSDRPNRVVGKIDLEKFIALWDKTGDSGFLNNPPNADLIGNKSIFFDKNKQINLVVELTAPHYDKKTKTLTYIAKPLKGNETVLKDSLTLYNVIMFIDSVCLSCWNGL